MALLCLILLASPSSAATDREIKVAIDTEYAPYEFLDSDGEVKGFLPDLLREIGTASGIRFRFIPLSWPDAVQGLENGEVDLINMIRTPAREKRYAFSEPHSGIEQSLFRNKNHPQIEELDSLSGHVVILQQHDIAIEKLARRNDFDRLIVDNKQVGFIKLNSGKAAAFLTATQPGLYFIKEHDLKNVALAAVNLWPQDYCFAAQKSQSSLIALLNRELAKLRASGRYDEIFHKWMIKPDSWFVQYGKSILILAVILFILFALLFIWNLTLRRAVDHRTAKLLESESVIRTLYQVSTQPQQNLKNQIRSLLQLGCERFNMDVGILTKISEQHAEIVNSYSAAAITLAKGEHFKLEDSYCEIAMHSDGPVVIENATRTEPHHHPTFKSASPLAFVGIKVMVQGQLFGTLSFAAAEPMKRQFEAIDIEALQLMASWLGNEMTRARNEDELLQSQKMEAIGTLVGGIAHDFNNTLAAMTGNLYLARKKIDEPDVALDKIAAIERLSGHAAEMVQQLLTFARKSHTNMQPLILNRLISKELKLSSSVIPENIVFNTSICREHLVIHGDATQLQQVLLNLLNNARDAVKNTGKPEVCCRLDHFTATPSFQQRHPDVTEQQFALLSVSDNGSGIPADTIGHIYEPFFTTKETGQGTGLGLSMVYGAIQSHGGLIEVESQANIGAAFHIYLPLQQSSTTSPDVNEPGQKPVSGHGETLLLVDDEIEMLEATGEVLSSMGYHILTATDGEAAVELFKIHRAEINLVISDIVMPKMSGAEAAKQMRQLNDQLPVIFVTGYDLEQASDEIGLVTGSITISKPFSFEQLSMLIRELIHPAS